MVKRILILILFAAALVFACACSQTDVPALLEPVNVEVQLTAVVSTDIYDITAYEATTEPETVACGFSSDGKIDQILVNRGDVVEKGDVIATLNTDLLSEQAEALQAQLDDLETEGGFEDSRVALQAELLGLQAETDSDAQAELDLLQSRHKQAVERRTAEEAELQTQLEAVQQSIENSVLTASCSGTVLYVSIMEGDTVQQGAAAVYLADDESPLVVTEYIDSSTLDEAARIYATIGGEEYDVTNVPYERSEYLALKGAGEDLSSTFTVDDPTGAVSPGMYTILYVVADYAADTLVLPTTAVFHDSDGYYVYMYEASGQVRVDVEIGMKTDAQVQILSGLQEGDEVYVGS